MYTGSEKYAVMGKVLEGGIYHHYNVDTFNIKLFKLEEV